MQLIQANSETFELVHIQAQSCTCGGAYRAVSRNLLMLTASDDPCEPTPQDSPSLPIHRMTAVCEKCGQTEHFYFDIHTFYTETASPTPPGKHDRFMETEAALRRALTALRMQQWQAAAADLQRALDPDLGEPDFAWAHYYLGVVEQMQGASDSAVAHLRRAVELVPCESAFRLGLEKVCARLGIPVEATPLEATGSVEQRN